MDPLINNIEKECQTNNIQNDYRILLLISGEWIIEQGLVEEWKRRRGMPESMEITPEWKDALTLQQADILGLLSWKNC